VTDDTLYVTASRAELGHAMQALEPE